MRRKTPSRTAPPPDVLGVHAAPARPTFAGAVWLALILAIPVGILGLAIDLLRFWLR